jgi:hypothetical protein
MVCVPEAIFDGNGKSVQAVGTLLVVPTLTLSTYIAMAGEPAQFCPFARTETVAGAATVTAFEAVADAVMVSAEPPDAVESRTVDPPEVGVTVKASPSTTTGVPAAVATGVATLVMTTEIAVMMAPPATSNPPFRNIATPSKR